MNITGNRQFWLDFETTSSKCACCSHGKWTVLLSRLMEVFIITWGTFNHLNRALPTCTLPSPTATDFQEVISGVNYGSRQRILTEDQVQFSNILLLTLLSLNLLQSTALAVSTPSNSSQLWCVMAAKFVLRLIKKLTYCNKFYVFNLVVLLVWKSLK